MRSYGLLVVAAFGCLNLVVSGCSSGEKPIPSATISGKVTLDGAPLEDGLIQFSPADGKNPTAGNKITAGKYSANVPKGMMKVSINASKVTGKKKVYDTPDSPMVDVREEQIPKQYNTETKLEADVKGNKSDQNFDLKTK